MNVVGGGGSGEGFRGGGGAKGGEREMSHASRTTSVACAPMTLRRPPHAKWRWLWAAAADAFFQA